MPNLKSNNLHHEFYPTDFALVDTTGRSAEQREKHRGKEKEDQMKDKEKESKETWGKEKAEKARRRKIKGDKESM
jgi:hypothetical protein